MYLHLGPLQFPITPKLNPLFLMNVFSQLETSPTSQSPRLGFLGVIFDDPLPSSSFLHQRNGRASHVSILPKQYPALTKKASVTS